MALAKFVRRIAARKGATLALDKDLKKIAALTETAIKNRTPVDTGRLRNSMTARRNGFLDYEVRTAVKYAPFVEFGTSRQSPQAPMRKGARDISKRGLKLLTSSRRFLN